MPTKDLAQRQETLEAIRRVRAELCTPTGSGWAVLSADERAAAAIVMATIEEGLDPTSLLEILEAMVPASKKPKAWQAIAHVMPNEGTSEANDQLRRALACLGCPVPADVTAQLWIQLTSLALEARPDDDILAKVYSRRLVGRLLQVVSSEVSMSSVYIFLKTAGDALSSAAIDLKLIAYVGSVLGKEAREEAEGIILGQIESGNTDTKQRDRLEDRLKQVSAFVLQGKSSFAELHEENIVQLPGPIRSILSPVLNIFIVASTYSETSDKYAERLDVGSQMFAATGRNLWGYLPVLATWHANRLLERGLRDLNLSPEEREFSELALKIIATGTEAALEIRAVGPQPNGPEKQESERQAIRTVLLGSPAIYLPMLTDVAAVLERRSSPEALNEGIENLSTTLEEIEPGRLAPPTFHRIADPTFPTFDELLLLVGKLAAEAPPKTQANLVLIRDYLIGDSGLTPALQAITGMKERLLNATRAVFEERAVDLNDAFEDLDTPVFKEMSELAIFPHIGSPMIPMICRLFISRLLWVARCCIAIERRFPNAEIELSAGQDRMITDLPDDRGPKAIALAALTEIAEHTSNNLQRRFFASVAQHLARSRSEATLNLIYRLLEGIPDSSPKGCDSLLARIVEDSSRLLAAGSVEEEILGSAKELACIILGVEPHFAELVIGSFTHIGRGEEYCTRAFRQSISEVIATVDKTRNRKILQPHEKRLGRATLRCLDLGVKVDDVINFIFGQSEGKVDAKTEKRKRAIRRILTPELGFFDSAIATYGYKVVDELIALLSLRTKMSVVDPGSAELEGRCKEIQAWLAGGASETLQSAEAIQMLRQAVCHLADDDPERWLADTVAAALEDGDFSASDYLCTWHNFSTSQEEDTSRLDPWPTTLLNALAARLERAPIGILTVEIGDLMGSEIVVTSLIRFVERARRYGETGRGVIHSLAASLASQYMTLETFQEYINEGYRVMRDRVAVCNSLSDLDRRFLTMAADAAEKKNVGALSTAAAIVSATTKSYPSRHTPTVDDIVPDELMITPKDKVPQFMELLHFQRCVFSILAYNYPDAVLVSACAALGSQDG